jgi:putative MATE family efflux protein
MDQRTEHLLTAPALPLLVSLSIPSSIAFIVQSTVSLTEVWYVGQLGSTPLAAMALVFPMLMLMQMLSVGALGNAVSSAIARALGAGDRDRAEQLMWHGLALAIAGPITLLIAFLISGKFFLSLLGGSGAILELAFAYSAVLFGGSVTIWIMGVGSSIFRGLGDMRYPARMMIIGSLIQVPLSGALVLGYFGSPKLGLLGAAVSVIATSALMSAVIVLRLVRAELPANLRLSKAVFRLRHFSDIGRVALPASLSPISTVATILILTGLVGQFGEQALAGYGIGSRIEFLMSSLIFGIGAAMTSVVGTSIGAQNADRAEEVGWVGAGMSFVLGGVIGTLLAVFPHIWIPIFTDDPVVYDTAKRFIQIVGPCLAIHGVGWALYFASQGAGAMRGPVTALIARPLIAVGAATLLLGPFDLGLTDIFLGAVGGMLAYTVIITASVRGGAWRRQVPVSP